MTMMVKNCQTYNQIILPIALASICGFFKFKSSNALLDTGDVPQGSNSQRCSAHLRIAEPSQLKGQYGKRTTVVMCLRDLAPIIQWNCGGLKFNLIDLITGPSSSPSCFFLSSRNSFEKVIQ